MAIGDDAIEAGFPIVPESGEEGRVRWGAREINRTRDMVAQVLDTIPNSKTNYQKAAGFTFGESDPYPSPSHGDVYVQVRPNDPHVDAVWWICWNGVWLRHHH